MTIIITDESTAHLKLPPILDALNALGSRKPVIFAQMDEGAPFPRAYISRLRELGVPFFSTPERAFRALACMTQSADSRGGGSTASVNRVSVPKLPGGILAEYESKRVLAALGIAVPDGGLARTKEEARNLARGIGYPVALKAQASALSHKSDAGGVVLNVDESRLFETWDRMHAAVASGFPSLTLDGILVERMVPGGAELIVGARRDPGWGPVLLVGFGGVLAEAMRDTRLLAPGLTEDAIVAELLRLAGAAVLKGFRGSPPLDVWAAAAVVRRLDEFVQSAPEVQEVEINPLVVLPEGHGALALDALIVTSKRDEP